MRRTTMGWSAVGMLVLGAILPGAAHAQPPSADWAESESPAPDSDAEDEAAASCVPSCRAAYVCVDGQCVSACNPPCEEHERCTADGECEPIPRATNESASAASTTDEYPDDDLGDDSGEKWWTDDSESLEPKTKRKSTAAMVVGIVLTGLGGVSAVSGAFLLSLSSESESEASDTASQIGTTYLVIGGVAMAVGIPLIVYGSSRVPANQARPLPPAPPVQARLLVGASSVRMRLTW